MLDARAAGHGRAGVFWQTQGSPARASRWCSSRRRCCGPSRATGRSWSSPTAWSWTIRSPRPSPRVRCSRGCDQVPRRERRASARAARREPPLRLHADPQVPDAGYALRPARRDRHHRRGAPQPIRHAGAEHARRFAEGAVPRLHWHAADRRRGAHEGGVRRLRLHLRLPAVDRGRRDGAALLREPHAGAAPGQPGPERRHLRRHRGRRTSTRRARRGCRSCWGNGTTSSRATTGWRRWPRTSCGISWGEGFRARRWSSPSTRPRRYACTTRCGAMGCGDQPRARGHRAPELRGAGRPKARS